MLACSLAAAQPPGLQLHVSAADVGYGVRADAAQLSVFDAGGRLLRSWAVPGGVLSMHAHVARQSVLVVLRGGRELWELQLATDAPPIYDGLVHDWRMGEGLASPGHLGLRRTPLAQPLLALCTDGIAPSVWVQEAAAPVGERAVLNLDVRRIIARCTVSPPDSGPSASRPGCGLPACPPQ